MGNAKKCKIQFGLFSIPVRLEVAVDKESSDTHTVCTGHGTHEPTRVKNHVDCPFPQCGESHSSTYGYPERGVERDGKLVVLTAEEIAEANGTPIKDLDLGLHPREKVYAATFAGDSVKYVTPDKGGEKGYTALLGALARHPEVVAVTVQAPGTKNALWVLEAIDDRLILSKRSWPEDVRPAPAVTPGVVEDFEAQMMDHTIEALLRDFNVTDYTNAAKAGMAGLIASRLGEAVAAPVAGSPAAAPVDMMAALQATLDQAAKQKPKSVAKATVKKAATKRPAKKTAPKESAA